MFSLLSSRPGIHQRRNTGRTRRSVETQLHRSDVGLLRRQKQQPEIRHHEKTNVRHGRGSGGRRQQDPSGMSRGPRQARAASHVVATQPRSDRRRRSK